MGKSGYRYYCESVIDPYKRPLDKDARIRDHIQYMLNRTQSIFEYTGLPETIPARMLELYLQTSGAVCITRAPDGDLYAFTGGLGGEPDAYYRPTIYTVANPYLHYSANLKIGTDCEIIINDSLLLGLLPLYYRYASAMAENEISLNIASINLRLTNILTAQTDTLKKAAEMYLKNVRDGEIGVIMDPGLIESLHVTPYGENGSATYLHSLIEYEQYLKASWYNEIGIDANFNMKREQVNDAEVEVNVSALLPLIDEMLRCRRECLDKVNAMYGLNISVRLASSWADIQTTVDASLEADKNSTRAEPSGGLTDVPPDDGEGDNNGMQ